MDANETEKNCTVYCFSKASLKDFLIFSGSELLFQLVHIWQWLLSRRIFWPLFSDATQIGKYSTHIRFIFTDECGPKPIREYPSPRALVLFICAPCISNMSPLTQQLVTLYQGVNWNAPSTSSLSAAPQLYLHSRSHQRSFWCTWETWLTPTLRRSLLVIGRTSWAHGIFPNQIKPSTQFIDSHKDLMRISANMLLVVVYVCTEDENESNKSVRISVS